MLEMGSLGDYTTAAAGANEMLRLNEGAPVERSTAQLAHLHGDAERCTALHPITFEEAVQPAEAVQTALAKIGAAEAADAADADAEPNRQFVKCVGDAEVRRGQSTLPPTDIGQLFPIATSLGHMPCPPQFNRRWPPAMPSPLTFPWCHVSGVARPAYPHPSP